MTTESVEPQANPRRWVSCSCGNIITLKRTDPPLYENEVRQHPACGREPVRITIPKSIGADE